MSKFNLFAALLLGCCMAIGCGDGAPEAGSSVNPADAPDGGVPEEARVETPNPTPEQRGEVPADDSADEPAADEPAADEPAADEPAADEPAAE